MAAAFQAIFRLAASNHSKNGKYSDGVWNSHLPTVKSSALRYKSKKDKGGAADDDDDNDEEEECEGEEEEEEEDGEIDREEKNLDDDDNANLRIFRRKRKLQELPLVKGADASETKKWQSLTVNVPAQPPSFDSDNRKYYRRNMTIQDKERSRDRAICSVSMPYVDWEEDVRKSMVESFNDGGSESLEELQRVCCVAIPPLAEDVVPFECFDTDYIDIERSVDPLDKLIFPPLSPAYSLSPMVQSPCPSPVAGAVGSAEAEKKEAPVEDKVAFEAMDFEDDENRERREKMERERIRKLEKAKRLQRVDSTLKLMTTNAALQHAADAGPGKRARDSRLAKGKLSISAVNHNNVAIAHKNTKPDLSEHDLRYFHRPRMLLKELDKNIHVYMSSSPAAEKNESANSNSSWSKSAVPMSMRLVTHFSESDKQSLSLVDSSGGRCNFILLEYIEEFPPILLNFGMASAIFNYFRPPADAHDKEEEEEARGGKVRSAVSNEGSAQQAQDLTKGKNRLPRHVTQLLQQHSQKQTYEQDDGTVPKLPVGETKVLVSENGEDPEAPFLGHIEPEGKEIQQAIVNNLFRAPIFRHRPHPTDFLLIRTKKGDKKLSYCVREIPYMYLCGQLEPQQVVPRPMMKINPLQEKFYLLAATRFLQLKDEGVPFSELQKALLRYCGKEKKSPHKSHHRSKLKDIVRKIASEEKEIGGVKWYLKDFDQLSDEDEALEQERKFSVEELTKQFTPEEVCVQESCNAAEYRLFCEHISDVELSKIESWLTFMHGVKKFKTDRLNKANRLLSSLQNNKQLQIMNLPLYSQQVKNATQFVSILAKNLERLTGKIAIARFLFDRLVYSPWNTTEAFVKSHLERDGNGRMELQGIGDPSGRGEAYSFVRIAASGPQVKSAKSTKQLAETTNDLRLLTIRDMTKLLLAFGVLQSDIKSLDRWDMVHLIREYSTRSERAGLAKELHKYSRGENVNVVKETESYKKICQDIWNRQKAALSSSAGPPALDDGDDPSTSPSKKADGEEDSDDDSDFAEDMEKALNSRAADSTSSARPKSEDDTRVQLQQQEMEDEKKELGSFFSSLSSNTASAASQKTSSNAAVTPKRKIHVGFASSSAKSTDMSPSADASEDISSSPNNTTTIDPGAWRVGWIPPKLAVKRTTTIVKQDGTEIIKVEYIIGLGSEAIAKVDSDYIKEKKDRDQRRNITKTAGLHGDEEDDDHGLSSLRHNRNSMSINLREMKKLASSKQPKKDVDAHDLTRKASPPAKYNKSGKQVAGRLTAEGGPAISGGTSSKRYSSSAKPTLRRVARVAFAARLEAELMELWKSKNASFFYFPVSIPGYGEKVQQPICLSDIREKIAQYKYETAAAMVEDVALMAHNSELFNGKESLVTVTAYNLLEKLKASLDHERQYLGEDKDVIRMLENEIKKRMALKRKSLNATDNTISSILTSSNSQRPHTILLE